MNRLNNRKISLVVIAFSALVLPHAVSASTVYLEAERAEWHVGDTVLVAVKVDSEDKTINAVEGTISLDYPPDAVSIRDLSISGSAFPLWPTEPSPGEDSKTVSFVSGIPGGLQQHDATLFKIALYLKSAGQITLSPTEVFAYLNDGKGTKDITSAENLSLAVLPQTADYSPVNDLDALVSSDRIPPEPFDIVLGQNDSAFDGKKFLSFGTTDKQSGVKYYEVREGNLPPVRSNGTYVLRNQDTPTDVVVTAYDAAGNSRESVYNPTKPSYLAPTGIAVVVVLLIVTLVFFLARKRKETA